MRVAAIRLVNWMAYRGEQKLADIPALPVAIVGRYSGNARRSNWAGKTALLEALGWALYGTHRKRLEDGLIHRGEDGCEVEVTLMQPGRRLRVCRTRPRGGPTRLSVYQSLDASVAGTSVRDEKTGELAQQAIDGCIGMSSEDFEATVWFAQGDTEALVGRTSGDRRRIVSRWLKLDSWDRLHARAKTDSRQHASDLSTLTALSRSALDEPLRDDSVIDLDIALLVEKEAVLTRRVVELDGWIVRYSDAMKDFGAAAELQKEGLKLKDLREQLAELEQEVPEDELERLEQVENSLREQLSLARKEYEESNLLASGGFSGMCPVVGRKCPSAAWVNDEGDALVSRFNMAKAEQERLVTLHRSARDAHARAVSRTNSRIAVRAKLMDTTDRMKALRERAEKHRAQLESVPKMEGDPYRERDEAVREIAELQAQVRMLEREKERNASIRQRRAKYETDMLAATQRARVSHLVARAFASTGIPARVAAAQLHRLEDRANALLSGTGLSFSLAWERETRDPAATCDDCGFAFKGKRDKACPSCSAPRGMKRSDELEVLVDDGSGEVEDVRAKSGGARVLVASAIRLAGGMMLRELRGSPVSFAVVDEPFGPLDAENREALARSFAGMLGSVGLEQAFVVSHDAALLDAMPARIVVVREGNSSRLELER